MTIPTSNHKSHITNHNSFITQHTPIVLASGSVIRAQMLKSVGLQFSVVPSGVDETALKDTMADQSIAEQAITLARAKAFSVSDQYPDHITIGADQICALGDDILSKPKTKDNAIAQLSKLSANTHQQYSGICLAKGAETIWEACETADLTMREMTESEIESYIQQDQPLHSCGSYKFESLGRHLFKSVKGDHDVIKGLPLTSLLFMLHQHNIISIS